MSHLFCGDLAKVLVDARRLDDELIAEVECYCENPKCCIRAVELQVKEHAGQKRLPNSILCPVCQQPMRFHGLEMD